MIKAVLFELFETLITESRVHPTRAGSLAATLGLEQEAYRAEWKARRPRIVVGELSFAEALTEVSQTLVGTVDTTVVQRICQQRMREKAAAYARMEDQVTTLILRSGVEAGGATGAPVVRVRTRGESSYQEATKRSVGNPRMLFQLP